MARSSSDDFDAVLETDECVRVELDEMMLSIIVDVIEAVDESI